MMRTRLWLLGAPLAVLALAGCTHRGTSGVFARRGGTPDEFAVGRAAPLTVPPDFALVPPRPGEPRPQEADSSTQALSALFGGQRAASPGENALLNAAGPPPVPGVRSETGTSGVPQVVDKGSATRDIVNAPATTSPTASAGTSAAAADTGPAAAGSAQASPANPSSGATPPPR